MRNSAKPDTQSVPILCLRVAFLTGDRLVTGEAWHLFLKNQELSSQEEAQGWQWCEVADDPVVVLKLRPVKAGNRLEGKTGVTATL